MPAARNPGGRTGQGKAYLWLVSQRDHSTDECLPWPFSKHSDGYGNFGYMGKMKYAHRFMCEMVNGAPPTSEHQAAHACGNRICVNPRHLSWKTRSGNQLDRRKHGTHMGSKGPYTKLTPAQIADIRQSKGRETQLQTAARYGVTRGCIEYWQKTDHTPQFHRSVKEQTAA